MRSRAGWRATAAFAVFVFVTLGRPAWAYRPFEGTDAAVADLGELEVELQPAGAAKQGTERTLVAPDWVVNYGFADGWEAVVQGQGRFPFGQSEERASFAGAGISLKHVLHEGSLQDKSGPSIATEFGALLPGIDADRGVGATISGIVSQRFEWTTIHLDAAATLTRDQHADAFLGAIIEGPSTWKVRPVAEIFYENEIGTAQTASGLVGAIWQVNDHLSLDIGFRHALVGGQSADEIRAGLTVGLPMLLGAPSHARR
ncbi:MAG TPA: hypothetical protein VKX28_18815 [Xanthobacteraceae bacterium]|nr:hypothetical protein [Xanthobacteraceae bacterium]